MILLGGFDYYYVMPYVKVVVPLAITRLKT